MPLLLCTHHRQKRVQPLPHHTFLLCALFLLSHHRMHVRHQICQSLWPFGLFGAFWGFGGVGAGDGRQAVVERDELFCAVVDKLFQPRIELIQV
jgi:hypothetical protein